MSKTKDAAHYKKLLKRHKTMTVLAHNRLRDEITSYKSAIASLCLRNKDKKITITPKELGVIDKANYAVIAVIDEKGNLVFETRE